MNLQNTSYNFVNSQAYVPLNYKSLLVSNVGASTPSQTTFMQTQGGIKILQREIYFPRIVICVNVAFEFYEFAKHFIQFCCFTSLCYMKLWEFTNL